MTKRIPSISADPRHESGEVSAETVLMVPVVFMVMVIAIQAAVFMHTAHVAQMCATEGAAATARFGGGVSAGAEATAIAIAELRGTETDIPKVSITNGIAIVTVGLRVPQVAPFFDLVVTRSAREPVERFMAPDQR